MHLQIITREDRLEIQSTYYRQGIANLLQVSVRLLAWLFLPWGKIVPIHLQ